MNGGERQNGFTLIEVMAAVLLLVVAFTVLLRVASGAMRLTAQSAQYSEAAMHARSLLDIAFVASPITAGNWNGRFDNSCRWHLQVSPYAISTVSQESVQLYRLDLTVIWGEPGQERRAHFVTLRAGGRVAEGAGA